MNLFVVLGGCRGDEHVIGIFSTMEKAEEVRDVQNKACRGLDAYVEEHELDEIW